MPELQGRRVADNTGCFEMKPGDYAKYVPENAERYFLAKAPTNDCGNLRGHTVTEHEDGTITVEPSILITTRIDGQDRELFHGYLRAGVWSW